MYSSPAITEIRILSHRPLETVAWWAALLDGRSRSVSPLVTVIDADSARIIVERSPAALGLRPGADGVSTIGLSAGTPEALLAAAARLTERGCEPCRGLRDAGRLCLAFRDPNGQEVVVHVMGEGNTTADWAMPEFVEPHLVLDALRRAPASA